jgi:hypothetical protein
MDNYPLPIFGRNGMEEEAKVLSIGPAGESGQVRSYLQ